MTGWYAVYTQSGMELWARSNLWERGCEVYLPRYLKRRSHTRRIDWVPRPLFSRYLFVRADPERGGTRGIDYAPGVVRVLRMGQRPSAVPDERSSPKFRAARTRTDTSPCARARSSAASPCVS